MTALAWAGPAAADDEEWLAELLGTEEGDLASEQEELVLEEDFLEDMAATQAELDLALAELNAWTVDGALSLGAGSKRNVLNSSQREVDSLFGQAEFDVFALKQGTAEGPQIVALLFGEYRHYADVPSLSNEHLAVAHTQLSSSLWGGAKGALSAQGVHSKQAFDASTNDFETEALTVALWQPEVKAALEKDLDRYGAVQVELGASQSRYSEKTEDSEAWAAGLGWSRYLSDRSRASVSWKRYVQDYATRVARFSSGPRQSQSLLETQGNRWEAEWVYARRDGILRKAKTKMLYQVEDDVVGDYYQRDQWEIRESLDWLWGLWRLETSAAFGNIDYAFRLASPDGPEPRADESLRFDIELSRQISRSFSAYARYEQVEKRSNADFYAYAGSSAALGIRVSKAASD